MGKDIIKDTAIGLGKGILSSIPGGSLFICVIEEVQSGVFHRKQEIWKSMVEERLQNLENQVKHNLGNNETFASVLITASRLAQISNEKKMELLANSVAKAATTTLQEDKIIIFLNCIEKYTLSHLKMLCFSQSPDKYVKKEKMMSSILSIYEDYYPNLDKSLNKIIIQDLYRDGLINTDSYNSTMTWNGCISKRTTALGDEMISFFNIHNL